jgi:hypothetical protein
MELIEFFQVPVAILAPTLPSSNISINETKFNVFPVPGDGNCFFHSLSFHEK